MFITYYYLIAAELCKVERLLVPSSSVIVFNYCGLPSYRIKVKMLKFQWTDNDVYSLKYLTIL